MEMQFDKIPVEYIQKLTGQHCCQEETTEVRLPDGMPDIGRVLGAWGQVIVRGKEWNGGHMAVSCGVMAWVLYIPEDETGVQSVEAWLPFSVKWELPETRHDGKILTNCLLKGVDARSTSARKLMVRATLCAYGEAWLPDQAEAAVPPERWEDVELLTAAYPVMLPKEAGEKAFFLEEQITTPASGNKLQKLMYYTLQPEILEKKVMAGKMVFRGNAALHALYRTEDGNLATLDYDLPFSQYADLNGEYDQDAWLSVQPCITSLDLMPDENGVLQLKAGLLGQYMLWDRTMVQVAEDAYSPRRQVKPMMQQLLLPAVLDRCEQSVHAEQSAQAEVQQLVDVTFCPCHGQVEYTDSGVAIALPGQFQMLYYDMEGSLCHTVVPWQGQWQWNAARECPVDTRLYPVGRAQAVPGGAAVNLRGEVLVDGVTVAGQGIPMVTGIEMGEPEKPDPNRPALILCRKGDRRLWDVAKQTGTTVDRILAANQLDGEPHADRILLIPVS